ncbi:uncharacterized protein LOC105834971 [Monomorium pharaonis]|uniref:uncharacterized protein LOC105834971 n=1 Tax=Monomorium pharaonis TaxID=307658 RepID=UPI0017473081|nr:uncharacterized protein LOC105834971 [Monomorium pharaonis]
MLINEMYDDDDDDGNECLVEFYRQWFHAQNVKRRLRALCLNQRQHHNRPQLYSEIWIDLYIDYDFFQTFRLKRSTFQQLLLLITRQREMMQKVYRGGYESVQPKKVQQIVLYYLAHQVSMAQLGDKFDVATSTVSNYVTIWIKCVIGAVNGCHINVMASSIQQKSYQNRYMTHSIILQGICTADYLFTNVYVGYPGSANDCRVLTNSSLYIKIEQNGYTQYFLPDQHLLGDKIYPIKDWLLPPFEDYGNVTRMQIKYNKIHSKTRIKIENSFGLLKDDDKGLSI